MDEINTSANLLSENSIETREETKKTIEKEKQKINSSNKKRTISDDLIEINTVGKTSKKNAKSIVNKGDSLDDVTKALLDTVSSTTNRVLTELEKAEYDVINDTVEKSYIPERLCRPIPINEIGEFKGFMNGF